MTAESAPAPKTSKLAIAALVMDLLFCVPLLPMIGTVLAVVALVKINNSKGQLKGQVLAIVAIVVGVLGTSASIGVIAAVAIPNFQRYQQRSRQAEVRLTLNRMKLEVMSRAAESESFPAQGDGEWTPAALCNSPDCKPDPSASEAQPFKELGVAFDGRNYQYRYQILGEGKEAKLTLEARGDLDHDGEFDIWVVSGEFDADGNAKLEGPVQTDPRLF